MKQRKKQLSRRVSGLETIKNGLSSINNLSSIRRKQKSRTKTSPPKSRSARLLRIMPFFLVPGMLSALFQGNLIGSIALLAGLFLLFSGSHLVQRGLNLEAQLEAKQLLFPPRLPNKNLGAIVYGIGFMVASTYVTSYGLAMGFSYGLIIAGTVIIRYGMDRKFEKPEIMEKAERAGLDLQEVLQNLKDARKKIDALHHFSRHLKQPDQQEQVLRIARSAEEIVRQIERDPRDIRMARKFMISYLRRAEEILEKYVSYKESTTFSSEKEQQYSQKYRKPSDKQEKDKQSETDVKFIEVLNDLETVFKEQNRKLLDNDNFDLEVKLDVLSQRLRNEGAG